ncbi:hypothetical protein OG866_21845 [Streptomyces sp. NBC_00663]|uniref:hypothetical protein n=1 Tax=Streptomyces sp. NBC_00663 TaxID=2975801 RepID=UPI002E361A87|nr:hypothetical protein [Streptomyces sp. NBC_00663]
MALAVVTLTGQPALADGTSGAYGFASDDQPVTGASTTADAQLLVPGRTYKSSLPADSDVSYRLDLDATSNAYVSVTAVPRAGTLVTATDGIRVTVRDADSRSCSVESAYVGPSRSPRPVVAWGSRETAARRTSCQGEGRYYVVVHRIAGTSSTPDDWDLELAPFLEPRLEKAVGTTPTGSTGSTGSSGSSGSSDSGSLDPLTGPAVPRSGGSGFGAAAAVEQGVWSVDISPGQTLFYAVPVGWGQRIGATAELGSTRRGGYMGGALNMALYNPARGPVDDVNLGYSGSQKSASLGSLPPVDYANRYASLGSVSGTRFAGTYYLALHLAEGMGEEYGTGPYEVTLRVRVEGTAEAGPTYDGRFEPPGPFEAAAGPGRGAAGGGEGGDGVAGNDGNDAVMTVVAAAGLGGGTLVLAALGVWTAVARRRAGGAW